MASRPNLSSEAYRQELVRDGQRRFQEWHEAYEGHCRQYRDKQQNDRQDSSSTMVSSESYRRNLVRDGQKRFAEWHQQFLAYQQKFLAEMADS
ncbi:MAG: hypothetical protein ACO3EZ_05640 [Prochlorotrichaceae cyanobacterium]